MDLGVDLVDGGSSGVLQHCFSLSIVLDYRSAPGIDIIGSVPSAWTPSIVTPATFECEPAASLKGAACNVVRALVGLTPAPTLPWDHDGVVIALNVSQKEVAVLSA